MFPPLSAYRRVALGWSFVLLVCGATIAQAEDFQGSTHQLPYEEEVIHYSQQVPEDPIAQLQQKLNKGEIKLHWDDNFGYLPSVLEALKVPASSQMLVFSKTSLQRKLITPKNPRALYYNDDVYVGYIPGAPLMEISAVDPKLGGIFYTLEQEKVRKPKFTRESDCLRCHGSARSLGVPGHILRSIATDDTGEIDTSSETEQVNQCTPLADRWAGWYVSGQHGAQAHRGNLIGAEAFARHAQEPNFLGNLASLEQFFETKSYLRPKSDIVALMVLEHQTHMHNYITRLNYETQMMMQTYGHIRYLKNQINAFLRYMLFTEEVPLTEPVSGDPAFVNGFATLALRDNKGRSLRDMDLQTRMFKYPCSYLIYSPAFDSLPEIMRAHLLERLWKILTGEDKDPQFAKIAPADRQAILEIIRETKPNLPDYWKNS
ncbi:hypothetical protein ACXR0O_01375 [Verrucomicrobiota bacterium sgz303538]